MIKLAMIALDTWLEQTKHSAKIIMQVHDELVFEVQADKLDFYQQHLVELMQNAVKLDVPLLAEAGSGNNWDEAH